MSAFAPNKAAPSHSAPSHVVTLGRLALLDHEGNELISGDSAKLVAYFDHRRFARRRWEASWLEPRLLEDALKGAWRDVVRGSPRNSGDVKAKLAAQK